MVGALAEQLHIDGGAEHAVAAVLGEMADAVVVRGTSTAVDAVAVLKESAGGRAAIVVVEDSAMHNRGAFGASAGRTLAARFGALLR